MRLSGFQGVGMPSYTFARSVMGRVTCKAFEARRIEHFSTTRAFRNQNLIFILHTLLPEKGYNIICRICLSKASRKKSSDIKPLKTYFTKVSQQQPTGNSTQFCDKVRESAEGLTIHIRQHSVKSKERPINSFVTHGVCEDTLNLRSHSLSQKYFKQKEKKSFLNE